MLPVLSMGIMEGIGTNAPNDSVFLHWGFETQTVGGVFQFCWCLGGAWAIDENM